MNNRKYKTNPLDLLAKGQAIMSSNSDSKYLFRVFAVNMVLSGTPASKVGASARVTKAAVTGWVKIADEQGFEALKTKKRPGRPSKLTQNQKQQIDDVLKTSPKDSGYKIWDGNTLYDYIRQTFNVELSVRQCQRLFHELGYSLIRPQSYPCKEYEDTEDRQMFKKNDKK